MAKRTFPPNKEIAQLCAERGTGNVDNLTFKDLMVLSEDSLKLLCAKYFFGDWWHAYKTKFKEGFHSFNHEQWDITLTFLGGTRLCGKQIDSGECPYPFERNLVFWRQQRDFKFMGLSDDI
jgi:hypothetical protein